MEKESDYKPFSKYEYVMEIKSAIKKGDDFLYVVGHPSQFSELCQSIHFIRQETGVDVLVDSETAMSDIIKIVVFRWSNKDAGQNNPYLGS